MSKTAVIIGAGPAGLTAAYELITRTDIRPIIIEKTNDIGGISKTVNYKGNRMDIGGHRFFSKSEKVMKWWQEILPVQKLNSNNLISNGPDPEKDDRVMLIRNRLSRIFFLRTFFDYPVNLNVKTLSNLGFVRIIKIAWSYLLVQIFPVKEADSLENFFISRFGKELYRTFFKDYTEKVWGISCKEIPADWGAQRIKKLSIKRALLHAVKAIFRKGNSIEQKHTDTSLIEKFMYPKFGPGQLWEVTAQLIEEKGGIILRNSEVFRLDVEDDQVIEVSYLNLTDNSVSTIKGEYFFSTMPVREFISAMGNIVPSVVKKISEGLRYRDFITVGLLLEQLKIKNETKIITSNGLVPDNWIYIQERDVKVGRLQIFNNWSPYMVANNQNVWIGLEYFCNEGDELWRMEDKEFIQFAVDELHSIDIIDKKDVIDSTLIRMPKTYPAYFGSYDQFSTIRNYTDKIENLFLIGRNGMHRYNNQDHSMLTAITAVDNIISGEKSKKNIWEINAEEEYHEEK